jgi:hypothetical protein
MGGMTNDRRITASLHDVSKQGRKETLTLEKEIRSREQLQRQLGLVEDGGILHLHGVVVRLDVCVLQQRQ